MTAMAVATKKLDVKIGDLVEIEGRSTTSCPTSTAVLPWSRRSR
jgi:hypothetical protein